MMPTWSFLETTDVDCVDNMLFSADWQPQASLQEWESVSSSFHPQNTMNGSSVPTADGGIDNMDDIFDFDASLDCFVKIEILGESAIVLSECLANMEFSAAGQPQALLQGESVSPFTWPQSTMDGSFRPIADTWVITNDVYDVCIYVHRDVQCLADRILSNIEKVPEHADNIRVLVDALLGDADKGLAPTGRRRQGRPRVLDVDGQTADEYTKLAIVRLFQSRNSNLSVVAASQEVAHWYNVVVSAKNIRLRCKAMTEHHNPYTNGLTWREVKTIAKAFRVNVPDFA